MLPNPIQAVAVASTLAVCAVVYCVVMVASLNSMSMKYDAVPQNTPQEVVTCVDHTLIATSPVNQADVWYCDNRQGRAAFAIQWGSDPKTQIGFLPIADVVRVLVFAMKRVGAPLSAVHALYGCALALDPSHVEQETMEEILSSLGSSIGEMRENMPDNVVRLPKRGMKPGGSEPSNN